MELRQLESLEAVLETGSFTRAARARHLSQPALWAQVKALGDALRLPLFVRSGRGVVPTAACLALRPRIRALLEGATGFEAAAEAIREGRAAPARIGCAPSHVSHFLARCLQRLQRAHPTSPLPTIVTISSATGRPALQRGELDLLVEPGPPGRPTRVGLPLYKIWIAAVGPLAVRSTLPLRALHQQPIATLPADTGLRARIEALARAQNIDVRIVHESREAASLLALAKHGVCTAIVTSETLDGNTAPVAKLTNGGRPFELRLWLRWTDEAALTPAARLLRDTMRDEARRA